MSQNKADILMWKFRTFCRLFCEEVSWPDTEYKGIADDLRDEETCLCWWEIKYTRERCALRCVDVWTTGPASGLFGRVVPSRSRKTLAGHNSAGLARRKNSYFCASFVCAHNGLDLFALCVFSVLMRARQQWAQCAESSRTKNKNASESKFGILSVIESIREGNTFSRRRIVVGTQFNFVLRPRKRLGSAHQAGPAAEYCICN